MTTKKAGDMTKEDAPAPAPKKRTVTAWMYAARIGPRWFVTTDISFREVSSQRNDDIKDNVRVGPLTKIEVPL